MNSPKKLSKKESKKVIGGTYYGNGVNCGKNTCTVNWGQALSLIHI